MWPRDRSLNQSRPELQKFRGPPPRDATKVAGQSQFYENIDQEGFAEQYGLTVEELHAERTACRSPSPRLDLDLDLHLDLDRDAHS